ncbi:MAG: sarcosine oxidase subunit gamma family protein [Actinomycetota bacterium]
MVELYLRSPLGHRAGDLARLDAVEVAHLAQIGVRCAAPDATRVGLPAEPNSVAGGADRGVLWMGPDEWLVVGLPGSAPAIVGEFEAALAGTRHAVVDVSANRAVIELRGTSRHAMLASGCGLDLEPAGGWAPGRCAQTLFARAQVLLQEMESATRVFVRPSFANYVADRLLATRRE